MVWAMQSESSATQYREADILCSARSIEMKRPSLISGATAKRTAALGSTSPCHSHSPDHPGAALGIDNCGRPLGKRGGNVIGHWVECAEVGLVPAVDGLHVPKR